MKLFNYGSLEESDITETKISSFLYKNFVSKYPDERDHFKPILDALDYSPSQLELIPEIIFTEGKSDYYIFKYMAKVILNSKYGKLNFFPGAGVDKYDSIFRLYLSWNRNFVAVFDSDLGGKGAKARYEKEIGIDIENKIFTFDQINKKFANYTVESFFTETEKNNIIKKVFPKHRKEDGFSKSKFNTSIQQMYISGENFDFNKGTLKKFENIFDFIQEYFKNK